MEAFAEAVHQGADWVELDVRLTMSGDLIVHHDPWYRDERTGGRGGLVWDTPPSQRPTPVPTLSEALDACRGDGSRAVGVNVEIKNIAGDLGADHVPHGPAVADAVVDLLARRRAAGIGGEILVSSFDAGTIDRVRALDGPPTAQLLVSLAAWPDAVASTARRGHAALHPADWDVDAGLVSRCHGAGLAVNVWTVNDPTRIVALAALGVDGIVTDTPAAALRALAGAVG